MAERNLRWDIFFYADNNKPGVKNEAASFYTVGKNAGACYTYPKGVFFAYVNPITKGREQIVNKNYVKMIDEQPVRRPAGKERQREEIRGRPVFYAPCPDRCDDKTDEAPAGRTMQRKHWQSL